MIKVSSLKPGALYFFSKSQRNCFGEIILCAVREDTEKEPSYRRTRQTDHIKLCLPVPSIIKK